MAKKKRDIQIRERTEKAWAKSYNSYKVARAKKLADGIALEPEMSLDTFEVYYSDNYEIHKKSIIRDIVEGEVLISWKQSKVYAKGFKESKIGDWIEAVRKEGYIIEEEIEKKLLQLPRADAKAFRSPEFRELYEELFPFIQQYNQSGYKRNFFTELINIGGGSPEPPNK